jgi:hypothetical protein
MKRALTTLASVLTLGTAVLAPPANAASIVQDTSGNTSSRFQFYWGQSFTTPAGTGWNNVSFNFYDLTLTPYAAGVGYLFGAAYAGTPAQLATAGALAVSAPANGSTYDFAPAFRLLANKSYYFYADAPMRIRGGGVTNVGGTSVFTQYGTHVFAPAGGRNADFLISGTALAVPEPASWTMLIMGFAVIGAARRRANFSVETNGAAA